MKIYPRGGPGRCWAWGWGAAPPVERCLFDDDLNVHARMRDADVEAGAGFSEGDRLRFAFSQRAGTPFGRFRRGGGVLDVADIDKGHAGFRLDPGACRPIRVFHVGIANLDCIHPLCDAPVGPATVAGGGGRHSGPDWPFSEKPQTASPAALP